MVRAFSISGVLILVMATCAAGAVSEHPLQPLLEFAKVRLASLDAEIQDYTCTLVKRERIDGRLGGYQHLFVKVRHRQVSGGRVTVPFSVYLRYLAPSDLKGREVIYVRGRNRGKLIARRGGRRFTYMTTAISPDSELAMRRTRYPITEIGMKNLIERLLKVGQEELPYGECEVKYVDGATINGRRCLVVQVTHPIKRDHFRYHMARIFIDRELTLPVRYASYDWPKKKGGSPRLIEEYTYVDVKPNVGLSDRDFDHRNPAYRFRKTFEP